MKMPNIIQLLKEYYWRSNLDLFRWKVNTMIGGPGLRTFTLPDLFEVDYPIKSEVGKQLFYKRFELEEVAFLKSVVRKGDIVLDLGANAGIYSILASKLIGSTGFVYAFEIGPKEIKLFHHNIAKNDVQNVNLIEHAVSDQTGQAQFAISKDGAMNSLAKNDHPHQSIQQWLTVQTITLNEFAERYRVERVDVIKMDVEGAEMLVFKGGLEIIKKWKPRYILFEASDLTAKAFGYNVSEFVAFLYKNQFSVYALESGGLTKLTPESGHRPDRYNFVAIPL